MPRWATCALTQLGFVRLSSNPSVVGTRKAPGDAVELVGKLVSDRHHVFIPELPGLPGAAGHFRRLVGHQQVTDAYLLAVAEGAGARLLTLDRRIFPPSSGAKLLEVLSLLP